MQCQTIKRGGTRKTANKIMKTLPKEINKTIENVLGYYTITRVLIEELNIDVTRYYICGCYEKGFFAAWNDKRCFNALDIEKYKTMNEAWSSINKALQL